MTQSEIKPMTLYIANVRGVPKNTGYPYEMKITCAEDMAKAAAFDNVSADYKDATTKSGKFVRRHRAKADFIAADNINMDCDNDEHDPTKPDLPPEEWKGPEDIQAAFPGVAFWFVPSRNHMKVKNNKAARPKGHYYFPQAQAIANFEKWTALKVAVCDYFPAFDEKALDAAHFLFGVDDPQPVYYPGELCIDEFMAQKAAESKPTPAKKKPAPKFGETIQIGNRHGTLLSFAGTVLKKYGVTEQAYTAYMQRVEQCEQPKPDDEIQKIWRDACNYYENNVCKQPDYIAPAEYAAQEFADDMEPADYTDVGQAQLFFQLYGDRVRYSTGTKWLVYNGKKWDESELKAHGLAQEQTDRQLAEARKRLKKARAAMDKAAEAGDEDAQKEAAAEENAAKGFRAFVLGRRKTSRIAATLTEAEPAAEISTLDLDADGFLLNTPAGTVDLKTGQMRPHSADDYITKMTAVSPSLDGMELWLAFLDRMTCGDKALQDYHQIIAGMQAVGKVYVENLIIATGIGGNGKSTFYNAQARVMGDYASSLSSDVLITNSRKNKSPEYAELRGKRLVIAAELEEGMRLDTGVVKRLCSVDPIRAEKKFKAPFDFIPSHTTVLYTNHLPKVGTNDKGTWDRLVVVPFNASFRGMKGEIFNYGDYLVEHAGGAILTWIIEGAKKFIAAKFHIEKPECVVEAIREYRQQNDWFHNFLDDRCEIGDSYSVAAGDLNFSYRSYCDSVGDFKRSPADLKNEMLKNGFKWHKSNKGATYYGLRLVPDEFDSIPPLAGA